MKRRVAAGILGVSDGATSIAGVIAGGAAAGVSHHALGVTAVGGALAAATSMAGAELLSQDSTDWRAIAAMGTGTLLGSALPALPLLVMSGRLAWLAVVCVSLALGCCVGFVRHRTTGRPVGRSLTQTLAVLAAGGFVGFGAGRFI